MPTRAVRFTDQENDAIKDFLKKNPYFDFSTIAKISILNFIQNPSLEIKASKIEDNPRINKIKRLQ